MADSIFHQLANRDHVISGKLDKMALVAIIIGLLLCGLFFGYLLFYLFHGRVVYFREKSKLTGKTVVITGGSSGIGREIALDLAHRQAKVIIASRNREKGEQAVTFIRGASRNDQVFYTQLDLADLQSVRHFAYQILNSESHLDILINNAAIAYNTAERTKDGYHDQVFATNYLGHFLLTYLLLDLLKKSAPCRIINMSSVVHLLVPEQLDLSIHDPKAADVVYPHLQGYDCSKLANLLHVKELTKRLAGTGVTANALHPGLVMTELWHSMRVFWPAWIAFIIKLFVRPLTISPTAAAQTAIHLAVSDTVDGISGRYFEKCKVARENQFAKSQKTSRGLWEISMFLTGVTSNGVITPRADFDYLQDHETLCNIEKERKKQNGETGSFVVPKFGIIDRV